MKNKSIVTSESPAFINLQPLDISPLISSCEIKVAYVGKNRNHSVISKEKLTEMAKTLRGNPIVGYYKKDKEDFADHGQQLVIDDEGVRMNCLTVPYGFVAPDAKVWFQTFDDYDEFGNIQTREYLMTQGYLWTGQFKECQKVIDEGKPQSMEFQDDDSFKGHWAEDYGTGNEFFIIDNAVFSKLCILGDDVEPCFEGASVTVPMVSKDFAKQQNFALNDDALHTLYSMKKELQDLKQKMFTKGGDNIMQKEDLEKKPKNKENSTDGGTDKDLEKKPKDKENSTCGGTDKEPEKKKINTESKLDSKKEKEKEPAKNHTLSETEYNGLIEKIDTLTTNFANATEKINQLESKISQLTSENSNLKDFKKNIEDKEKDDMINSFYMLSDEDKQDVIANKDKYSLDDIESKLSVICFRKKINFTETQVDNNSVLTYNLQSEVTDDVPDYIKALRQTKEN